jgi:hypothetical protein
MIGSAAIAAEYHVSTSGSDENPGTADRPFATLERARQAVRDLKAAEGLPDGGVRVWVHSGDHFRQRTFELGPEDSGSAGSPVIYQSTAGAPAWLVGGRLFPPSAFQPVADAAVLARLDTAAKEHVRRADLAALGMDPLPPLGDRFRSFAGQPELFFNDRPMARARWPNDGWVTIEEVIDRGSTGRGPDGRGGTFVYSGDRPRRWSVDRGVWLHGYWCHDWNDECLRVASVDPEKRQIKLAAPHVYGIGPSSTWNREPRRYYAVNLLEELDQPGEWFLDREAHALYFWPPEPPDACRVVLSTLEGPLVALKGASHVTLAGLTLDSSRGTGVAVSGGTGNRVAGCTFRNLGGTAVTIAGGTDNGVTRCEMHQLARGGITVSGGDRKTLTPAGNFADGNHVRHYGRLQRTYAGAIHLSGVGNRAAGNLIHDAPHTAIFYGGNEHTIERNEIHHVALETSDVGAIYTGRDWTSRGNLLRWNFIHDLGQMGSVGTMGIYLDDCASGDRLVGNVFFKAGRAAFIGGGRDNLVENNLMIECDAAVHLDARGTSRIRFDGDPHDSWNLPAKAQRLDYRKPPWSTRYPKLARVMDEEPALPLGNVIRRNVSVRCKRWLSAGGMDKYLDRVTFEDNLILDDEDPGFVDPAAGNFRLRPDSIIRTRLPGFEPIPMDRIGLQAPK